MTLRSNSHRLRVLSLATSCASKSFPSITRSPLFLSIIGLTALTSPGAGAQNTDSSLMLEEVTVTARRRSESLQDVPIAVTAFSAEKLDNFGILNISELAEQVPSVTLEPTRATNTTLTAFIRGIGQQDPLVGFEPGVAIYLDDVYLARPQGALLDIYDVERVEVLRGPQGTLYGRNAVGGAIKYVTRRLAEETEVRVRANIGQFNQRDLIATASTPIGDKVRIGGTVASLNRDGYGDNLFTGAEHYNRDLFAYRISAEFLPTDSLLIRIAYDDLEDKSNPVAGFRPFPAPVSGDSVLNDVRDTTAGAAVNPTTAAIGGRNELEGDGWMVSLDWNINDAITLRSITAQREDFTENVIDFDGLAIDDFDAPVVYDNEQFSQEFQLLYNSERLNVVSGFYYLDAEASNDFDVILGQLGRIAFGDVLTSYTGGQIETEAWSVFADATYDITDQLSVSVGLRYTEDERDAQVFRGSFIGTGSPFFGNTSAIPLAVTSDYEAKKTFYDASPRFNINYRINDDMNVYGGYSRGWKAGTFDPRGANFVFDFVEQGVNEEVVDAFELGFKGTWLDGRAITNIAVFYSDYTDLQVPGSEGIDTDGDGVNDDFVGTLTNAGEAEISGIEFEGSMRLSEHWSLQGSLSLLDPEITEFLIAGTDVSDNAVIQNTPEETAFLAVNYTVPVFGGDLSLTGSWSYRGDSSQFEFTNRVIDQESFSLFNASAVWVSNSDTWMIAVHGKNLSDEDVVTSAYCFGASASCPSAVGLEDNTTLFFGPPRTFFGTVEYRF